MNEELFAGIIVFFASMLQAMTGFGFAIVATPFLLLVFNSRDCIQISILVSLFIAVLLVPRIREHIDLQMLRRLAVGSILGVPAGLVFFSSISLPSLKLTIGAAILTITVFSSIRLYKNQVRLLSDEGVPEILPSGQTPGIIQGTGDGTKCNEFLVGLWAGVFTTGIGMPGVPLALYFSTKNTVKEVVRSTTLAFFIAVYIASIIAQIITVRIENSVFLTSLLLMPAAAAGVIIGHHMFPRINQKSFQLITNCVLIYTSLYMMAK